MCFLCKTYSPGTDYCIQDDPGRDRWPPWWGPVCLPLPTSLADRWARSVRTSAQREMQDWAYFWDVEERSSSDLIIWKGYYESKCQHSQVKPAALVFFLLATLLLPIPQQEMTTHHLGHHETVLEIMKWDPIVVFVNLEQPVVKNWSLQHQGDNKIQFDQRIFQAFHSGAALFSVGRGENLTSISNLLVRWRSVYICFSRIIISGSSHCQLSKMGFFR